LFSVKLLYNFPLGIFPKVCLKSNAYQRGTKVAHFFGIESTGLIKDQQRTASLLKTNVWGKTS